ncbi:peroxiredoxin family protein [Mangrovivirga cuniculi]|uniref:Alkyl hydroperoxide reductase subunit C/ Thiol specific antioxidant domain-containing protein n=1 Tax=Mangrovivirga cuniculi TaxID=2715131 RepID=A0A4D7JIW6_9BACT|nr:redoxin domain-containing protein [Mangrovivirga cuniculi]QCK14933.1 hypothetical protein DCC35_09360 [Mangrovivirga cuniculi]
MKKIFKTAILILFGIAIIYQFYIFIKPDESNKPSIPDISLVLLDNKKTSVSSLGDDKHTIVFLVNTQCDYCKKEINELENYIDRFVNTEVIFILFEDLEVIKDFKNSILPQENSFITFAQASREEVKTVLEKELVYPYMLWYDNKGIQKVQHRGLYPIARIIESINNSHD